MIRFWNPLNVFMVKKLERTFVEWSSHLDELLLNLSENIGEWSDKSLDFQLELFEGSLYELYFLNRKYRDCFYPKRALSDTHPNYEKAVSRLECLRNLVKDELYIRIVDSQE